MANHRLSITVIEVEAIEVDSRATEVTEETEGNREEEVQTEAEDIE